uniref:Uncharacterized protein n=2 Tax=Clytia hemisphaerica TaxID=252671 RepID=A0A7M5V7G5_9CNID
MEEIPCIIHPLKLMYMEGEKLSGCAVIEVVFSTPTGVKHIHYKKTNSNIKKMEDKGRMEEIPCIIHPLKLMYMEGEKLSGCAVIEAVFSTPTGVKLSEMSFKNHYVYKFTVKGGTKSGDFITLVQNQNLMNIPHSAAEAQSHHRVSLVKKHSETSNHLFTSLRFILHQPSPRWQTFRLDDIKFYKIVKSDSETKDDEDHVDKEEKKTVNEYSTKLKRLESGLKSAREVLNQCDWMSEENVVKPFEVDGSYDINLLSYSSPATTHS